MLLLGNISLLGAGPEPNMAFLPISNGDKKKKKKL